MTMTKMVRPWTTSLIAVASMALSAACTVSKPDAGPALADTVTKASTSPRPDSLRGGSQAVAAASAHTVLVIGTSLTAGLGLDPDSAYPQLLHAKIEAAHLPFDVVNAGVSGETTAGLLRRL